MRVSSLAEVGVVAAEGAAGVSVSTVLTIEGTWDKGAVVNMAFSSFSFSSFSFSGSFSATIFSSSFCSFPFLFSSSFPTPYKHEIKNWLKGISLGSNEKKRV